MSNFDLNSINSALSDSGRPISGVDFSGKSLKLDTAKDAQPIVEAINACPDLQYLTLTGNTLGVAAAEAISKALEHHPELKIARFSDMFTGRMKTEIPPALAALGDGMITAGARLSVLDLSDNAFGPIGVEGLAKLLQSDVCSELEELRLNNNGLGITGGRLLAKALSARPRRLKIFIAGRNRLENDGATALAKVFQNMGTLEELAMPQNGIYHVGISALSEAFKHNQQLARLNLNDNTVGAKGAQAIAAALPKLKNLKCINFGDCLLKSKGALALAKAFKDNSLLLESLDLSHNEIGRDACMQVVEAITILPDSAERLSRVVLAGNSLGGAGNKKTMRDKLGASAELSDGEGSDDEYVTDSDEDNSNSEEDEESQNSEDSATEDAQHDTLTNFAENITLDTSGVQEIESDVGRFLAQPTLENLQKLGPNAADVIDVHLQSIKDPAAMIQAYVDATFCVAGLSDDASASQIAEQLFPILISRAGRAPASAWLLANCVLSALALIKSEEKPARIRWSLPPCYACVSRQLQARYFPAALRDTLRFFAHSKRGVLPLADVLLGTSVGTCLSRQLQARYFPAALRDTLRFFAHSKRGVLPLADVLLGTSVGTCLSRQLQARYFPAALRDTLRFFAHSKRGVLPLADVLLGTSVGTCLSRQLQARYFPAALRDTLRFFAHSKRGVLPLADVLLGTSVGTCLSRQLQARYFPAALRDTLRFFAHSKRGVLPLADVLLGTSVGTCLSRQLQARYFPAALRDTLRFFAHSKRGVLPLADVLLGTSVGTCLSRQLQARYFPAALRDTLRFFAHSKRGVLPLADVLLGTSVGTCLSRQLQARYFPAALRDTLRFFAHSKRGVLPLADVLLGTSVGTCLSRQLQARYFPAALRDTLRFFAHSKRGVLPLADVLCQ
uniref:Uncharacterized protein n=1 Tax=Heliothis virescens TaxID=7102 RepID=A0A2A4K2T7_HELVI